MNEYLLHQVLRENPELIEPGLTFVEQEVNIGHRLRCDLLFKDKEGRNVYVEVKLKAGRTAVVQIEQYETVKKEDGARYILAALYSRPGIPEIVARRGFEFKKINIHELLSLKPEWKDKLSSKKREVIEDDAKTSFVPRQIKDKRIEILISLEAPLKEKLPEIRFNRSPESRYRLIMPWKGNDYFLFDFSSEVPDGIRCAFVVDIDKKHSPDRQYFQDLLKGVQYEVEQTLNSPVVDRTSNTTLIGEGLKTWTKISKHRRMGVHTFFRYQDSDWTNVEEMVKKLAPCIHDYVERMNSLLHRYRPKKNKGF